MLNCINGSESIIMSLKITIQPQIQAFRKQGVGWLQLGLQGAPTYILLPIYDAYEAAMTFDSTEWTFDSTVLTFDQTHFVVTELTAVKIDQNKREINRASLPVSHIAYDSVSRQFKTQTKLSALLGEGNYYLEFKTTEKTYESAPFQVEIRDYRLTFDSTFWTFDSTQITFDQFKINI